MRIITKQLLSGTIGRCI